MTRSTRAYSSLLYLAIALGAVAVWSVVPFATLWALSHLADDGTELLVLGLLAIPSSMIIFAVLLGRLNTAYISLQRAHRPPSRSGWEPRMRGPLEQFLTAAPIAAAIGFIAWFALRPGPPFHL